ncbi:MAG: hypothetical protein LBB17_00415 [Puniceicoccales bacterium]|jgi:hypothetical protein|nr:hypothetical protein [Puniceicoccales bacterium]
MAKANEYSLETERFDGFEMIDGGSESDLYRSNIRNLIVLQLIAASPASLPFDIIFHGISCSCKNCPKEHVIASISGLVDSGSIVKISECGFGDRYRLKDNYPLKNFDTDE